MEHSRHGLNSALEEAYLILVNNERRTLSIAVRFWLYGLGIGALIINISCTGSSPGTTNSSVSAKGNQPPAIISAKILNDPISLTGPVEVQVDAQDPEREAVSFEYRWYVDNVPVTTQTNAIFPVELLRRGQIVFVEIIPSDSTNRGHPYKTKSVVVGNTAPKVTAVSLSPQMVRTGDKLEAQVEANDPDHDRVDLSFKWFRNDTIIKEGEESFLNTTGFSPGDIITMEVTAQDPAGSCHSLKSGPLALDNSAPKIVTTPPTSAVHERFDYSVKALDPDGDQLTYYLEMAPSGMTIGPGSGQIGWQVPTNQQGTFHVKVLAKDGHGGLAMQEFELTLTAVLPTPSGG